MKLELSFARHVTSLSGARYDTSTTFYHIMHTFCTSIANGKGHRFTFRLALRIAFRMMMRRGLFHLDVASADM